MAETHASLGTTCLMDVRVPQLVPPGPNAREHWATKARRVKKERRDVKLVLSQFTRPTGHRFVVTLTRCGRRRMDPDNLVACMKGPVDEVASWLGIDDGDERVTWQFEQRTVQVPEKCTLIRIERRAGVEGR